jgi:hypothetical protein
MNTDDYLDSIRKDDFISQASQYSLFHEVTMKENENIDYEQHNPIISNDFLNSINRQKFDNEMLQQ